MTYSVDEFNDDISDEEQSNKLGFFSVLVLLIVIVALLGTLIWPLLYYPSDLNQPLPTPTSIFLREA